MNRLKGKTAIITGASSGIGRAASSWETPEDVAEGILYACIAKNTVWEIRMR